ncbi:hypothetical protein JD844_034372 [Phrynosoma platyrhinos]|uniref:Occludin n=1 Tax=Phrynosoma platyrhinos TaxID=52577 RepID=A0ABQ7T972_PHRPL|nr:hypothetical protein JD844_034372 [Phrynosoma platyrhinos]
MYNSKKPYEGSPAGYGPPEDYYGYEIRSPAPGSYYVEDVPQHFYKWNSPPGIVRILEGIGIFLCVAIFACVASTLAWDYGYGYGGMYGGNMGGYYGNGYYGNNYYGGGGGLGGYYGNYYGGMMNPRSANGFMIAMSVLCFIALLALAITSLTKSSGSRSRRFYLVVLILCAILAFIMLIASIVYVMGVNPRAQMSGSYYYNTNPMLAMCNQIYTTGAYMNHPPFHTPADGKPSRTFSSSTLEEKPTRESASKPSARRGRRRRRNPELDESQYETDYTTAMESSDERDQDDWSSLYPPITSDGVRQTYKQEFDTDLKRYKQLCAEMDGGVAEEYNRLKDLKRTPDYQTKKMESKSLRNKLFHIKKMVSDYDKHRG